MQKISMIVMCVLFGLSVSAQYITVYSECDYKGKSQVFSAGRFSLKNSRIGGGQVASVKVPSGMKVILYTSDNPGSGDRKVTLTYNSNCLSNEKFYKAAWSIVVEKTNDDNYSGNRNNGNYNNRNNNNRSDPGGVTLYEDCSFGGKNRKLSEGRFNKNDLGIGSDALSSVRVPRGYSITLFEDDDFKGSSITYSRDIECLPYNWNDKTTSIIISRSGSNRNYNNNYDNNNRNNNRDGVELFRDCGWSGRSQVLGEGDYPSRDLGIGDNQLSSLTVPRGWKITLYYNDYYKGLKVTYYNDVECLSSLWNDNVSSVQVERTY